MTVGSPDRRSFFINFTKNLAKQEKEQYTFSINRKGVSAMDIKGELKKKVDEIADKVTKDKDIGAKFAKNPIKTVEDILGVDLPDDQVKQIAAAVKTKINLDKAGDIAGKLGGLLGKK